MCCGRAIHLSGLAALSFFAGWLCGELAGHVMVLDVIEVAGLWRHGAATTMGMCGLGLHMAALAMFAVALVRSRKNVTVVRGALAAHPPVAALDGAWLQLVLPIPVRTPGVERVRDLIYFEDSAEPRLRLKLDLFRRRGDTTKKRPILLYVHGGAWVVGNKRNQGLPMLQRLAAHGFIGFSINYRLSPRATFPDHIIDVKRAIAWVRAHAEEYGGDPDFIVIAGGSAGGHLAALAALTPHKREWQPGFEDADTSVTACVSLYGIFDFTDRHGHWHNPGMRRLLERYVFKATHEAAPERFAEASPMTWVSAAAPPFLVVQGTHDTLVPVAEARAFVAALHAAGAACTYLELPGAQHAFEVFPSLRTQAVGEGIERFIASVRAMPPKKPI